MSKTIREVLYSYFEHSNHKAPNDATDQSLSDIRKLLEGALPELKDTDKYYNHVLALREGYNHALNDTKEAINKIIGEQQ